MKIHISKFRFFKSDLNEYLSSSKSLRFWNFFVWVRWILWTRSKKVSTEMNKSSLWKLHRTAFIKYLTWWKKPFTSFVKKKWKYAICYESNPGLSRSTFVIIKSNYELSFAYSIVRFSWLIYHRYRISTYLLSVVDRRSFLNGEP